MGLFNQEAPADRVSRLVAPGVWRHGDISEVMIREGYSTSEINSGLNAAVQRGSVTHWDGTEYRYSKGE